MDGVTIRTENTLMDFKIFVLMLFVIKN